jgi:hypothetical protein
VDERDHEIMTLSILIFLAWLGVAIFALALCRASARGDRRERRYASESSVRPLPTRAVPAARFWARV